MKYVSYKDLKSVTADLKKIYTAKTEEEAHLELKAFSSKWEANTLLSLIYGNVTGLV